MDTDSGLIEKHFSQFGEVEDVKVNRQTEKVIKKCFAFVTFKDAKAILKPIELKLIYIPEIKTTVRLILELIL